MVRKSSEGKAPTKKKKAKLVTARATPKTSQINNTVEFYLEDYSKTLFPLVTNKYLIEKGEREIREYVAKCLDDNNKTYSFSAQRRVYAAKQGGYLRRTVKLDVAAEYYIYDVVFRNRKRFRKPYSTNRTHYGYRFEGGKLIAPTAAYKGFKGAIADYSKKFPHSRAIDVASYFNHIYHHDIVAWFAELGADNSDTKGLGQLLREINSGRSVDCLPQGLYPTKMIGSDFLRFLDNFHDLKAQQIVRFMDDVYLFSNSEADLANDFQVIQHLLGEKGLSINPRKTRINDAGHANIDTQIDKAKRDLLKRRRIIILAGYDEDGEEILRELMIEQPLSKKEIGYIDELLAKPEIEEEDAELILTIMRGHANKVEARLPDVMRSYPHLAKNVHNFFASVADKELVAEMILQEATNGMRLPEFQLFWFAASLEEHLMDTSKAPSLISALYNHISATVITKAKILEIADGRYGLPELRNDSLMSGQSDWLAWSSAVGSRKLNAVSRNHRLKYFGNSSHLNHLIASILLNN